MNETITIITTHHPLGDSPQESMMIGLYVFTTRISLFDYDDIGRIFTPTNFWINFHRNDSLPSPGSRLTSHPDDNRPTVPTVTIPAVHFILIKTRSTKDERHQPTHRHIDDGRRKHANFSMDPCIQIQWSGSSRRKRETVKKGRRTGNDDIMGKYKEKNFSRPSI